MGRRVGRAKRAPPEHAQANGGGSTSLDPPYGLYPRTRHDIRHTDSPAQHADAHLAHHFETLQQQYDSGKLGIWLFLTTEILMFSGLFCGYAVLSGQPPGDFPLRPSVSVRSRWAR